LRWTRAMYVGMRDSSKLLTGVKLKSHTARSLVAIAVEMQEPKGFGRIRLRRVPVDSERYLLPFVRDAVEPGTRVHTDGSAAYRSLSENGYVHQRSVHLGSDGPAHVSMPGVHRLASLLKRWLLGTHQGAVQPAQLDYYLDEFTAPRARADCCSIDCWSRPSSPSRCPISASSPAECDHNILRRWS
jgi:hypothetical protein